MKRTFFRLSISLLTFAVGYSVVLFTELFPVVISPVKPATVSLSISLDDDSAKTTPVHYQKPRFSAVLRSCWAGIVQVYMTDDEQQVSEGITFVGNRKEIRAEFKRRLVKAVRVIEHIPNYKNHRGKSGERVVLVNPPDDRNPMETVSILYYDRGQSIAFIDASTLDLALEFEQFLEANDYPAP
jgi:hypothetical protein